MGTLSYNGPFFSLPSTFLAGTAAAGGIGLINTIGGIGRAIGPSAVGVLKAAKRKLYLRHGGDGAREFLIRDHRASFGAQFSGA